MHGVEVALLIRDARIKRAVYTSARIACQRQHALSTSTNEARGGGDNQPFSNVTWRLRSRSRMGQPNILANNAYGNVSVCTSAG